MIDTSIDCRELFNRLIPCLYVFKDRMIDTSIDCRELFNLLIPNDNVIASRSSASIPYWNPLFLLSKRDNDYITLPVYRIRGSIGMLLKNRSASLAISAYLHNMYSYSFIRTSIGKNLFHYLVDLGTGNSLLKVKTKQNAVYYVGRGVIFNEKFTPLIITTVTLNTNTFKIKSGECRINPILFEENSLLSKTIIKDVLPFLPTISARFLYNSRCSVVEDSEEVNIDWENHHTHPKIIIEPLDEFIYRPKEGNCEEINNFLSNNLELITTQLK